VTTPVLVGAATAQQQPQHPGEGVGCEELLVEAVVGAIADAGAGTGLASTVDLVVVTQGLSMLVDGAQRVAQAIGAPRARPVTYQVGIPQQTLISQAIDAVRRGEARTVVVAGAETKQRDTMARRAGVTLDRPEPFLEPDELVTPVGEIVARAEVEVGAVLAVQQYALIDNARRAAMDWTLDEHRDDIAAIWASFNAVAQDNPRAAFPSPMPAAVIREPSDTNPMLAFPYNKWHSSQWTVDQAAALVITSTETAATFGIDPDRRVFPYVGVESSQSLSLTRRADLHRWPAMAVLGRAAQRHIGRPLSTVDYVELYSCYPAAVRVQQAELGLEPAGPATITGGMTFAGGPFNNFVFQATAAMVARLRADPGAMGLVTAVSGLLTKPGIALWSTAAPAAPVLLGDLVDEATAATPIAPLDENPVGSGTIATYTVAGERIVAIVDLDSGLRAVAALDDPVSATDACRHDLIGTRVGVVGRSFAL